MEPVRLQYRSLPAEPNLSNNDRKLDLKVIFTDLPKTAAALATARTMARGLGARITLMVARVVPYPLPLAEPDVPVEFTERLLESLGNQRDAESDVGSDDDTAIEILLCRDRNLRPFAAQYRPDSLVIVARARKVAMVALLVALT